jgi:hypothetical protein
LALLASEGDQAVQGIAVERLLHEGTTPLWLLGGEAAKATSKVRSVNAKIAPDVATGKRPSGNFEEALS